MSQPNLTHFEWSVEPPEYLESLAEFERARRFRRRVAAGAVAVPTLMRPKFSMRRLGPGEESPADFGWYSDHQWAVTVWANEDYL